MKRPRVYILAGLGAVLAFWCCLILACLVLGWVGSKTGANVDSLELLPPEPAPSTEVARREPTAGERETGKLVEGADVPGRDLVDLAQRLRGMPATFDPTPPPGAPVYEPGDTATFWLHDIQANSHFSSTARLGYATAHAYWWIEEGYDIPPDDLARSAANFEEQTYPTNRRLFGSEWSPGIDGDVHVYIFLGNVPGVGGYYSPPDEYPVAINRWSNEHEMFYINLENAMPGDAYFDGILAHEFQHMIHWAEDADEASWVNEGLSELAAQLNGYDVGGTDYEFLWAPDTQLTTWSDMEVSGPHYGASYLFMAYLHGRYGDEAIRRLVAEPADGMAGIDAMLDGVDPDGRRFVDVFADWTAATYLDTPSLADGRYDYSSLTVDAPRLTARYSDYPVDQRAAVSQYAADYIRLDDPNNVTVEFTGSTVVPLVGNRVNSGSYQWWSNRSDEGDARLTRAFDLTGLTEAGLKAWLWYDLETDYDYAYVEVSTDGGQTWDLLANEHTTTTNPSGNSYGPALTGTSGDGSEPVWVEQHFDLTPYAGREILVRFEVVTDEELNYRGLCIDGVSIPELGYSHDAETDGGWQGEGFIRVTDHIPQQFLVYVILRGRGTADTVVQHIPLDATQSGRLKLAGLGTEVTGAILVVTAQAPSTTEPAVYHTHIGPAP